MIDPSSAPRRDDLPFLRRRTRPRPAGPISFDRPGRRRAGTADPTPLAAPSPAAAVGPTPPAAAAPAAPRISFDRPGRAPAQPPAAAHAPSPPPPARVASSSLDLDEVPPPAAAPAAVEPPEPPRRERAEPRVAAGTRTILTVANPTITLTRLQSAIGTLTVEAACSAAVGDLRLGCAYELADGYSGTVQLTDGNRFAPPRSRRPVIVAAREQFDRLAVDLRQCRGVTRLAVYAFSVSRQPLRWGGTLVVTTFGEARVELSLEHLQGGSVALLLSAYNIRGEFVLRGEMQTFNGGVREAVRAYGYDRISWLDDRTPVE